jgi:hypothetical protein
MCNNSGVVTFSRGSMMQSGETNMPEIIEENKTEDSSIEQRLFEAQKEIDDLKSQIMWLERSYE